MKRTLDWKQGVCVALGLGAIMLIEPMFEPSLFGGRFTGTIAEGVRAGLGVFLGICAYYLAFRPSISN